MASENIKDTEEKRKKNDKVMIGKADIEIKIKHSCWINEKSLNELKTYFRSSSFFPHETQRPE